MSGYIIHFDNETELAHYGVKGMKWRKHKSAKKIGSTPLDGLHGAKRRAAENKLVDYRVRQFEKKNSNMYKAQPKQQLYRATTKKVGDAEIADFGRIGATVNSNLFSGNPILNNKSWHTKIDLKAANKIVNKANNKRYKAQTNVIQRGLDKFADWVNKKKGYKKSSTREKLFHW